MSDLGGGLNRSTQHFIAEGKIDYRPISQRFRDGKKAAKKMSLWDTWLRWELAESDWASVWQAVIVIYCRLTPSVASTG